MFFFKVFFLHRFWTTIAAIGSVNITWWKLDILPGYSTTTNPAEENPMKKKDSKQKLKKKNSKKKLHICNFSFFFQFHFQADDYGINRLHHIQSDLYTYLCLCM